MAPIGIAVALAWLFAIFPLVAGIGRSLFSLIPQYNGTLTNNYTYFGTPFFPSFPGYYGGGTKASGVTVNIVNSQQQQMKQSANISNTNTNTVSESISASASATAIAGGRRFLNYDPTTSRPTTMQIHRRNKPLFLSYFYDYLNISNVFFF